MKRVTVHIEDEQYEWLHSVSERNRMTAAELLRQAIEHWINLHNHPFSLRLKQAVDPNYDRRSEAMVQFFEEWNRYKQNSPPVTLESLDEKLRSIEIVLRNMEAQNRSKGVHRKQ